MAAVESDPEARPWEGTALADEVLPALPVDAVLRVVRVPDREALSGETITGRALLDALVATKAAYVRFDSEETRRRFLKSRMHVPSEMIDRGPSGTSIGIAHVMALVTSAGFLARPDGSVIRIERIPEPSDG
jgi:hypothetical protein